MKILIMSLVVVCLFTSCATTTTTLPKYIPPAEYVFKKSEIINKSYDDTYTNILKYFSSNNIPIKILDKKPGYIITNNLIAIEKYEDCDCGKLDYSSEIVNYQRGVNFNMNIILSEIDSNKTEVTIDVFYKCEISGNSTGKYEKRLFEYIKGTAPTNMPIDTIHKQVKWNDVVSKSSGVFEFDLINDNGNIEIQDFKTVLDKPKVIENIAPIKDYKNWSFGFQLGIGVAGFDKNVQLKMPRILFGIGLSYSLFNF